MKASKAVLAAVGLAGVCLAGATVAVASIPNSDTGIISACLKTSGAVQIIDTQAGAKCASGERLLSWNQVGPVGEPGPEGPEGPEGPAGPSGGALLARDGNQQVLGEVLAVDLPSQGGQVVIRRADGIVVVYGGLGEVRVITVGGSIHTNSDCSGPKYTYATASPGAAPYVWRDFYIFDTVVWVSDSIVPDGTQSEDLENFSTAYSVGDHSEYSGPLSEEFRGTCYDRGIQETQLFELTPIDQPEDVFGPLSIG